jgi:hypothetical protein
MSEPILPPTSESLPPSASNEETMNPEKTSAPKVPVAPEATAAKGNNGIAIRRGVSE